MCMCVFPCCTPSIYPSIYLSIYPIFSPHLLYHLPLHLSTAPVCLLNRKPPDALFGKALTASSKSFEKLYPGLAGPTMILNLPFILQAVVG